MATLSPITRPLDIAVTLGLSPQLIATTEPSYSLPFPHPSSFSFPSFSTYKSDDIDRPDDPCDGDFSLYHHTSTHHLLPLSPTSSSSLSPPHSLSSSASVASASSASSSTPPPCSACSSCCPQARRLALLVPALKQKVIHTASLMSLYQSTKAQVTQLESRLRASETAREEVGRAHSQCTSREGSWKEEVEMREVRLRAQDSHISQLKASYSKVLAEKEERGGRERSIKELQREVDQLLRKTERLREGHERMEAQQRKDREEEAVRRSTVADESIDWLTDDSPPHAPTPIIIELSPASPSSSSLPLPPSPERLSLPADSKPSSAAVGGSSSDFDVSRTMALATAAMNSLKAQLQQKTAVIQQLRAEKREWTRQQKKAGLPAVTSKDEKSISPTKRRKGSRGQVMSETPLDEFDDIAAEVERALQGHEEERGVKGTKEEQREEAGDETVKRDESPRDVIQVVRSEVVLAKLVTEPTVSAPAEVVKRKRGRPRIHPIKEKKEGAKRGRPRKTQPSGATPPTEPPTSSPSTLPPLPRLSSPPLVVEEAPTDSPPSPPTKLANVPVKTVDGMRSLPHAPPAHLLQQLPVLLHAFSSAAPQASTSVPVSTSVELSGVRGGLVGRLCDLLCPCPCSSQPLLVAPRWSSSLLAPAASLPPLIPSPLVDKCRWCSPHAPPSSLSSSLCGSRELLHWNDFIDSLLRYCTSSRAEGASSPQSCIDLLLALSAQMTSRWHELQPGSSQHISGSSLLDQFFSRAVALLLSSPLPTTSVTPSPVLFIVLHLVSRCEQSIPHIRSVLMHSVTSSQLSLPLFERVAALCPSAFAVAPSIPLSPTHHIKALRLITASLLRRLPASPAPSTTDPSTASPYPTLSPLLSSETASLCGTTEPFVFTRLVSELVLHATATPLTSHSHFEAVAVSIQSAFHLLSLFLSFPILYSLLRTTIQPALPRCKSSLHSTVYLLIFPPILQAAVRYLTSDPIPSKEDQTATRQAVSSVLRWAGKVVQGGGDIVVQGAAMNVICRAMGLREDTARLVSVEDRDWAMTLQAEWVRQRTEAEVQLMENTTTDAPNAWLLLPDIRQPVKDSPDRPLAGDTHSA